MRKLASAAVCIAAVVATVLLFANSYAQFERKVSREAEAWRISWADRR